MHFCLIQEKLLVYSSAPQVRFTAKNLVHCIATKLVLFWLLAFVLWGFLISRKILGLFLIENSFSFELCQRFITWFESKWKERGVSSI